MKIHLVTAAMLLIAAGVAGAHDCWLAPERFVLEPGDTLVVRQRFGHELHTDLELALDKELTSRFELIVSDGVTDLIEEAPERIHPRFSPLLERQLSFTGLGLLVMDHRFETAEFSSDVFYSYVDHEELHEVRELLDRRRATGGEWDKVVQRERYARATKSLIRVGSGVAGDLHNKLVGQTLEILLLQNPYLLDPGDVLDVQVLFDGKPLVDALVWAQRGDRAGLASQSRSRTDDNGVARFSVDGGGFWLIRVIHMMPCSRCPDADWTSYWASYSFEVD